MVDDDAAVREFVALPEREPPAVILLDMRMPVMDRRAFPAAYRAPQRRGPPRLRDRGRRRRPRSPADPHSSPRRGAGKMVAAGGTQAPPKGEGIPVTVLVVDDDPDIRGFVREVLSLEGRPVVEAGDGAEALRAVEREPPCAIILDMRMPRLSGWEFARRYRQRPGPHAPIICTTAEAECAAACREVGAAAALPKPFELGDLLAALDRLCP